MRAVPREPAPAFAVPRRWPRVALATPVLVELESRDRGTGRLIPGNTRDLSAGGVYVVSPERVHPGAPSQVYMACPGGEAPLHAAGVIVRSEPGGFAIAFAEAVEDISQLLRLS